MLATKILTNVGQKIVMIDADQKPPRRCRPKNITNWHWLKTLADLNQENNLT